MQWFLSNLCCGGCFDGKCGSKQLFSLLLVAKDRENPAVVSKKGRSLSRYAGGRLAQCIVNGRLSVHEKSVAKSRWSLKPVVV